MARCGERVIYGLIDGDTMELRYIGLTIDRVRRLAYHKKANGKNTHLNCWLRKTHWNMIILERDPPDLNEAEMCWIHDMREQGARLLNHTDGGGGTVGWNHSLKVRAKIGAANRGHSVLPETRAKIGIASRGKTLSPETRAKISAVTSGDKNPNFGKHHTAKSRAKMSASHRARWALRKENGA